MPYIADLHMHSKYSRATSKDRPTITDTRLFIPKTSLMISNTAMYTSDAFSSAAQASPPFVEPPYDQADCLRPMEPARAGILA